MPKLKAPEGFTNGSHDGVEFEADKNGMVDVPDTAVADLLNHGFTVPKAEAPKQGGK
jgi:hypothetical protein